MKKPFPGQVSDVDLRLLRVFRTVVDSGGFAAAELQLNIGRSTISRHIKDLEARLGVSLCRRGRGGFALTPEGSRIYQATLRVLGSIADLRSEIHDLHQRLSGSLQLALFDKTVTNPQAHIATAIGALRRLAPDVSIEIRIHPLNEIERGILDGRFHLGVMPVYRRSGACEYHPLFDETHVPLLRQRAPAVRARGRRDRRCRGAGRGVRGSGLPLRQHGARPRVRPGPARHRLRPGRRCHADPLGCLYRLPAGPLRRELRGAGARCARSAPSASPTAAASARSCATTRNARA